MKDQLLDGAVASGIIEAIHGLHLNIPMRLLRKVGDLEVAAFIGLAAFLSGCCKKEEGWFFLEQEREPDSSSESMFLRIGGWRAAAGLGKEAQLRVRRRLEKLGFLVALPSERQKRLLELGNDVPLSETAFIFEQVRGAPPRLHYKVDQRKYAAWLGSE